MKGPIKPNGSKRELTMIKRMPHLVGGLQLLVGTTLNRTVSKSVTQCRPSARPTGGWSTSRFFLSKGGQKLGLANKISYYLPKARTNYGKFNIRFSGVKVWNSIEDSLKSKSHLPVSPTKNNLSPTTDWFIDVLYFPVFACAHPLVYCYLCVRVCVWMVIVSIVLCSVSVLANFFPLRSAT